MSMPDDLTTRLFVADWGLAAKLSAAILGACLSPAPAQAQTYQIDEFHNLPRLTWDDTTTLARAPGDWDSRQWSEAGLGLAAVVAVGFALDHAADQWVVRNRRASWDQPAKDVAQLGGVGGLVLIGGGYLGASWLDKPEARSLWVDAGIATALARGSAFVVQFATDRAVPSDNEGTSHFRPFSSSGSFPSGHTSQALAMASVISMHADSAWVGAAAYGLAGMVGLARMETRDHFASDVVAGALLGTTIGRAVVHVNQAKRAAGGARSEISFAPIWRPDYRGIQLVAKF